MLRCHPQNVQYGPLSTVSTITSLHWMSTARQQWPGLASLNSVASLAHELTQSTFSEHQIQQNPLTC